MKRRNEFLRAQKREYTIIKVFLELIVIFLIITISIALYDMYINIEVDKDLYTVGKVAKEIESNDANDISSTLEKVSKSVVRNFKN